MANIEDKALGNLLQIVYTNGIRNQISVDFRDFEMIKRAKAGSSVAKSLNFMFQSSLGPAAIQYRDPGVSNRAFPRAQQAAVREYSARFKEMQATIALDYSVWDRARKSPEKFGEPLALELSAKTTAGKRRAAADLYGDGTGVVGTVVSAAVTSPASNKLVFQLSTANSARGHAGFFEYDDILMLKAADGTASALNTSLATEPAFWQVVDRDYETQQVTLKGLDSNYAEVATITSISTQPTSGDVLYRYGQSQIADLTAAIADYGVVTEVLAGLESLVADDGRVIHGITMSGVNAGSRISASGSPIDVKHIQKVLSKVKRQVGQDRYQWKQMIMTAETLDSLIESRETDRRFNSMEDATRGTKKFVYQHQNDALECYTSEFCPPKRVYMLPETRGNEKVIEFHGSDYETVKMGGMADFHLMPGAGGGHVNTVVSYLQAIGTMVCKHPAAVAVIEDFTNS